MAEEREEAEAPEPEPEPEPETGEPEAGAPEAGDGDPEPEESEPEESEVGEPEAEESEPEESEPGESEPGGEAKKKAKPLPGAGTEEGERLRAAHRAFEVGDYRKVRALCDDLLEARDGEVSASARELRGRTAVDPVQVGIVLACLVLLGLIAYVYVL
jgi:hypothetical protein